MELTNIVNRHYLNITSNNKFILITRYLLINMINTDIKYLKINNRNNKKIKMPI